jgi:hypothetical protein
MIRPRLTKEQRLEIVQMYDQGKPIVHLAQQFKVTRPTIYNVIEEKGDTSHKKIDFYFEKKEENKDMSELTKQNNNISINFLGVKIDTENGPSNPKIRKALDKSFHLLDIMMFIEVTKFNLNMTMFDYFWQVVVGNHASHLTSMTFDWFGYEGEYYTQKQNFIKMLKRNNISYNELTRKDKEIEMYPTIKEELLTMSKCDAVKSKFLIMEPDDIKMAIMQLKTKNGHIIRQYYIDLEKLLKLYVEYTLYFNHREAQRKITDLEQMMVNMNLTMQKQEQYMRSLGISLEEVKDQNEELLDTNKGLEKNVKGLKTEVREVKRKLGIAVVDRAPQPEDESKRERFVLLKYNDPDFMGYYTIRAQDTYTIRKLKIKQLHFPDLVVLLDFKCSPNSKTLYNRIKENLKAKNVIFKGNNIDLDNSELTEQEFIEEMKVINDQKLCI